MSDTYLPVLKDAIASLRAYTTLTNIVGQRIYTDLPDNETFPYCAVTIDSTPYDTKDKTGREHILQVNIYSRQKEPKEAADIRKAIYDRLNRNEAVFTTTAVVSCQHDGASNLFKDQDGVTWFAVIQFRIVTMS